MEESKNEKLGVLSIKVNNATKERFNELKEDGAFDTAGQFMETLLERYSNPIKVNKQNEEVIRTSKQTIEQLNSELENTKSDNAKLKMEIETLNGKIADIDTRSKQAIEDLNSSFAAKNEITMKGHILVPITPVERKCLEYLADRENKERKRNDITPEIFFMYCVSEMLIKGNKFSIKCVPDSVLAKIQKEVENE